MATAQLKSFPAPLPRVAVFNPVIAHYRSGLVRELRRSIHAEYHFFADTQDREGRIPALDFGGSADFIHSPFSRVLKRIVWQPQAVRIAWSGTYTCCVFMGDAAWLSTWIAAALARLRGRRVLFWTHGWMRRDRGVKKYVRLAFYGLADGLLLYGEQAARIGADLGYSPQKLHVMFNSLDFDAQQALTTKISIADVTALRVRLFGDAETPVVIATARLTAVKRFDLLIEALDIVNRKFRRTNLLVVGDGPERKHLEVIAASTQVKCAFVGTCYEESRLAAYFLAANVTVSPGNVGLTCMHSLGYGVPVITHDDPSDQMPEWEAIEIGVTGDVFRKGSVVDLAQKIEKWTRTSFPLDAIRRRCRSAIETKYHPKMQAAAIDGAVRSGKSAARRRIPV
jgi:glycosyltransferase involved in cell wall biosynthesis